MTVRPAAENLDQAPPYEVLLITVDPALVADGHEHVVSVDTQDPDGGTTRWTPAEILTALGDGAEFVVADDGAGRRTRLAPSTCPICPTTTLGIRPAA